MSYYHEDNLSPEAMNISRALVSMKEELEAVDWYHQRADATNDAELQSILEHNRDEEVEHACMLLEYLRRNMPSFDENLKTYLFTQLPVTQVEEAAEQGEGGEETQSDDNKDTGAGSLGIGSLAE